MVYNETFSLIIQIIPVIALLFLIGCVYVIIKNTMRVIKNKEYANHTFRHVSKYNLVSILCIAVVILSWFTNTGWIRVIFMLPMIVHAIVFYFSNWFYHRNYDKNSKSMNIVNRFVYGTYLLGNSLLPDFGDTEDSIRVFFGIIKNDIALDIAGIVSELLLIANVVLIIKQIIYTVQVKSRHKM